MENAALLILLESVLGKMKNKSSTNKTASITIKIDSDLKNNVEHILNRLGLNHSSVIQILYNQIELTNSLPFNISIPEKINNKAKRTVK
jgi:addiction module RelB/DinJ family antitoxin